MGQVDPIGRLTLYGQLASFIIKYIYLLVYLINELFK